MKPTQSEVPGVGMVSALGGVEEDQIPVLPGFGLETQRNDRGPESSLKRLRIFV